MKLFWPFFDRLIELMAALAGVILVFITASVCYTIGMRYLFKETTIWIIQTCEYALLWIVFLGTTWLLRERGHITTDIIYVHLSATAKRRLDCIMFSVGGLVCCGMAIFGILHLYDCVVNGVTDVRAVTVPKSAIFVIIPIGSILLAVQFFRMAWSRFREASTGR